jgi:hypothetical protein
MQILFKKEHLKYTFIIVFLFLFFSSSSAENAFTANEDSLSDSFNIKDASFLLPQPLSSGKYSSAIYLLNLVTPKAWTLDNIKAPMLCYSAKYTLPHGFNLQASLATLFISNRINLGPFWNYSANNWHFGAGYQVVFNYGRLNEFGFKTTLTGWEQQPSATIGYSFKTMALTLRSDLYWTNALYVSEGDNMIPYTNGFLNGYSFSLNLEQRLWKNHVMSFGFKWSYLKYHILAWPAFPVNNNRYAVPEFQMGLNF